MTQNAPLLFAQRVWKKAKTPSHVQAHCKKVAAVAVAIVKAAKARGFHADVELARRAALVHDACKIRAMKTGANEKSLLRKTLSKKSPELEIVLQTDLPFLLREQAFCGIESLIVYYADKRVMHTNVVSLRARLFDLLKRYPMYADDIRAAGPRVIELERALVAQFKFRKNLGGLK